MKKKVFYIFVGLDIVLFITAVVVFGYLFAAFRETRIESQAASQPPQISESAVEMLSPSPIQTPTPTPTPTPQSVYETERFRIIYNPQELTLTDRSGETGRTAITLAAAGQDMPRLDIQILETESPRISQEDFAVLAQASAAAYFADNPAEMTVSNPVMEESVYLAELQIAASDVSPAMEAQIRWIPGTDYGVLAVCLIPQDADPAWLPDALSSLVAS